MSLAIQRNAIALAMTLLMFAFTGTAQTSRFTISNNTWQVDVAGKTGLVTGIRNLADSTQMNWVHSKFAWGELIIVNANDTIKFDNPIAVKQLSKSQVESIYKNTGLQLTLLRTISKTNTFNETYAITNTGNGTVSYPAGSIDLTVPLHDSYEGGAKVALKERCNAHIWAKGSSAYINAIRMSGNGPHLGLALTQGSLAGYSLSGATFSNDRGCIAFNPEKITLKPGQTYTMAWTMFWNDGWNDFWKQALKQPSFVKLEADRYTVVKGENINITGTFGSVAGSGILRQNGKLLPSKIKSNILSAHVRAVATGEQVFELEHSGRTDKLVINVVENPMELIKARVAFIVNKQQRNEPGYALDGAYLLFDNETREQYWSTKNDKNEARERVGMGMLLALYLPHCKDEALKAKIKGSLKRFEAFIAREIQDTVGIVYNASHYKDNHRIYNSPWVGHFHLAMYQATHDKRYLQLFTKTVKAYYTINKSHNFDAYPIGLQIKDGLKALQNADMQTEYQQVYHAFYKHASRIAETGGNYPESEVAYEQSIVAPGVQICLEMYLVTREAKFLESAKTQMKFLEAFNGKQPDYHLNDLAIRHWDDYWFGKYRQYGDTFPHYWQTLTAIAFDEYAEAGASVAYRERAKQILMNNLCLFSADGTASCAYVYPLKSMGLPGERFDPWANDQDWALVNLLTLLNRGSLKL